ncbi:TcpQ domain-containing protein [Gluconobacter cerinus]
MKKAFLLAIGAVASPVALTAPAFAGGLVIVNSADAPPAAPAAAPSRTSVQDASSAPIVRDGVALSAQDDIKRVLPSSDFGSNIPLSFAIRQVLPPDMMVHYGPGVDSTKLVSWKGGRTVQAILDGLSGENGLKYLVEGQLVTFVPKDAAFQTAVQSGVPQAAPVSTPVPPAPAVPAPQASASQAPAAAPAAPAVVAVPPQPANPEARVRSGAHIAPTELPKRTFAPADGGAGVYYAPAGEEIDAILANWAAKTGWMVAYKTDMRYRLEAPLSFNGTFEQAVSGLIDAIQATPRPRAMLYRGNHVVHVYTDDDN